MDEQILSIQEFHGSVSKKDPVLFDMLTKFCDAAELFNQNECTQDVVSDYLNLSADCRAILDIFKGINEISAKDVAILFRVATCILARVASDLKSHSTLGCIIVADVLKYCCKSIANFLRDKKKQGRMRATLNLIAAMVVQEKDSAQEVFTRLNFCGPNFQPLFNKSNPEDEEDVRALLLNIIVLMLSVGDNNLVRQIVEAKGFLNCIFPNIASDRASLIVMILNTLEEKVLKNMSVAKTSKIRLFNDFTVKFILKLYSWSGPVKLQLLRKRKLGQNIEATSMECSPEEVLLVTKAANSFLTTLCCSYKFGVVFRDWSYGTSGKNQNHVITNLLKTFPNPHCNLHMSDFVVSVLKTCVDQRKYYLSELKDSFVPRRSDAWFKAISMLKKVIESGNYVTYLFTYGEKKPALKLVAATKTMCFPDILSQSTYHQSFMSNQLDVCHSLLDYLYSVLKEIDAICSYCCKPCSTGVYSDKELEEFREKLISSVAEMVPSVDALQSFSMQAHKISSQGTVPENIAPDCQTDELLASLAKILDILTIYRQLKVAPPGDVNKTFLCLLEHFRSVQFYFESSEGRALQLRLVELLSEVDSLKDSPWLQNTGSSSPFSFVLDGYMEAEDEKSILKSTRVAFTVFKNAISFDGEEWEIDIWLSTLRNQKKSHHKDLLEFFSNCLYLFRDQKKMAVKGSINSGLSLDVPMETDVSVRGKTHSSLVSTVLEHLNASNGNSKACRKYVQSVLCHIFYRQPDPQPLYVHIEKYAQLFDEKDLSYWKFLACFDQESLVEDSEDPVDADGAFCDFLRKAFITFHSHSKRSQSHDMYVYECLTNEIGRIKTEEIANAVWQLLMYINLEAKRLFMNSKSATAIPSYASIMKDLMLKFGDSKTVLDRLGSSMLSSLLSDILSHPAIMQCFLPSAFFQTKKRNYLTSAICGVTNLVFEILKFSAFQPYFKDLGDTLLRLKTAAVIFHQCFSSAGSENDEIPSAFFGFFESTVSEFSSILSANEVGILMHFLLSVDEDLSSELDPQFQVLALLAENDSLRTEYCLLPTELVKMIFSRCCEKRLRKRHKKLLRGIVQNLLQRHPVYCHCISSDSALALLSHSSSTTTNFKLLTLLIANNPKIRSKFQKEVLKQFSDNTLETTSHACLVHTAIQCIKFGKDDTFLHSVSQPIWNYICIEFFINAASELDLIIEDLPWITAYMMEKELLEEAMITETIGILYKSASTEIPHATKICAIMKILQCLHNCSTLDQISPSLPLLQLIRGWLQHCLKPQQEIPSEFFAHVLKFIQTILQNSNADMYRETMVNVEEAQNLIRESMLLALKNSSAGGQLMNISSCLMVKTQDAFPQDETKTLDHLKILVPPDFDFDAILQNEDGNFSYLKDPVIHFLATAAKLNFKICDSCSAPSILSVYGATLSKSDQEILYVLKMYDNQSGIKRNSILWGHAAVDNYAMMTHSDTYLLREPKMQVLLGLFHQDRLEYTIMNFPFHLSFEISAEGASNLDEESPLDVNWNKSYDPRFVLNVLCTVLSPGSFINCRDFIDSSVLSVVFACLSSYDQNIRAQAYYCLTQFYTHLEGSTYAPRKLWISFLDQLRNSIETPNARVPFIISLFLAKSVKLLRQPDGRMYVSIYQFLTVKPCLDIGHVPEFYKLFNGCGIEYRIQRCWLLTLLAEGLRTSLDFHLCQKRYIFTLLLPHFFSSISTEEERLLIIRILLTAVRIPSSARTLCQLGLLDWLDNVIKSRNEEEMWKGIGKIMHGIHTSYISIDSCPRSTILNFQLVMLNLLDHISAFDQLTLRNYVQTLLKVYKTLADSTTTSEHNNGHPLLLKQVFKLCQSWEKFKIADSQDIIDIQCTIVDVSSHQSKSLHELFSELIFFCRPCWNDYVNSEQYDFYIRCLINTLHLILDNVTSYLMTPFCNWLTFNLNNDSKMGLSNFMLSSDAKAHSCVKLMLQSIEKEMSNAHDENDNGLTQCLAIVKLFKEKCNEELTSQQTSNIVNALWKYLSYRFKEI